jgi:hypothetical protein
MRVFVPDARNELRYLRVTWHPDRRLVVLSHWRDDVCLASTPIDLTQVSKLIGLLVGALEDAAVGIARVASDAVEVGSGTGGGWPARWRAWMRPRLAQVVPLRRREGPGR